EQHLEIVIAVDVGRTSRRAAGTLTELGHQVNLAARLAEFAVDNDDRVGLVVFAGEARQTLPPQSGVAAVTRIRAILRELEPQTEESNPLAAVMHIRKLVRHRSLVVLPADLEDSDGTGQLVQSTRLLRPTHLPLLVSLIDPQVEELAQRPARSWLDPYVSLAAINSQRHISTNQARLRQLGATVVRARPLELDHAVLATYAGLRRRHRI
ncbi:MAG: VWA domain-containing protein, partial [Gammaproteobacteria bacterium]|nr:VWA domain-containing protein [Gammaproteobacteria bacterium]